MSSFLAINCYVSEGLAISSSLGISKETPEGIIMW